MKKNIVITFGLILIFGALLYYAYFFYSLKVSSTELHNLGNSAYREDNLESALEYYSGSLALQEHEDTRFNYILTKELLEQREDINKNKEEDVGEKQEEGTPGENKQNSGEESSQGEETETKQEEKGSQDSSSPQQGNNTTRGEESSQGEETETKQEEKGSQDSSSPQQGNNTTRGEEYMLEGGQEISEMSQEERDILEQTLEELEQEQIYHQGYYNKKQEASEDPFMQMQKRFFGNIYTGGEKDW